MVRWTPAAEEVFNSAKAALASVTSLNHPDPNAHMGLFIDASSTSMGAVLQQWRNGTWEPLVFWSHKPLTVHLVENCFLLLLLSNTSDHTWKVGNLFFLLITSL